MHFHLVMCFAVQPGTTSASQKLSGEIFGVKCLIVYYIYIKYYQMLSSTCCLGLIIHIYIYNLDKQAGSSAKILCGIPLWIVCPSSFFVGRKLKPQSNKSHRAMHGSSPCGATEGNKCQLDSIFQNISAFVFKWRTFTREFDSNFLYMMLFYAILFASA